MPRACAPLNQVGLGISGQDRGSIPVALMRRGVRFVAAGPTGSVKPPALLPEQLRGRQGCSGAAAGEGVSTFRHVAGGWRRTP